jgi:hypothetical protein
MPFRAHCQPAPPRRQGQTQPAQLGSFCTFALRPASLGPRPTRNWVRFARFSSGPRSSGRNWLRFAQSQSGRASRSTCPRPFPGARAKLGSFCTFHLRPGPLASPNWVRFAHLPSGARGRAGPNWVRFARLPPARARGRAELGSFCTFACGVRPQPPSANPQFAVRNPQSGNWVRLARIVTSGTKRTAVNRTERLLSRRLARLVLTFPAGRNTSWGLAVPAPDADGVFIYRRLTNAFCCIENQHSAAEYANVALQPATGYSHWPLTPDNCFSTTEAMQRSNCGQVAGLVTCPPGVGDTNIPSRTPFFFSRFVSPI